MHRTHLATLWGTTEIGYLVSFETEPEDWDYLNIDAAKDGIEWVQIAPDRFEMRFVKSDTATTPQLPFLTMPDAGDLYRSGDLFSPHPSKDGHWRCVGRSDYLLIVQDMLFDPTDVEKQIEAHAMVRSAVVLVVKHTVLCLIVELYALETDLDAALDSVWPTVSVSCDGRPECQRIRRERIVFVRQGKLIPRNHKGEVIRYSLAELYSVEIDA